MSMYKTFKTEENLEENGIIIDYGTFRVTLARAGGANKKFGRLLEARTKPFKRLIQTDTMDQEIGAQIMREVYAEAVVLNWEVRTEITSDGTEVYAQGLEDPNDDTKIIPFTKENLVAAFKALPDLFSDLQEQATKAALFREQLREEDAKN